MTSNRSIPFKVGAPVIGEYFIDRDRTINEMNNLIQYSNGNILLYGKRRVGKTSLCLQIREIAKTNTNEWIEYMSMETQFESDSRKFIQASLLTVINKTAGMIFKKKYSDLLFDLNKPRKFPNEDYNRLLDYFELARGGADAISQDSSQEAKEGKSSKFLLSSSEMLTLLNELVEMLGQNKIRKFVILVDEANKLTLDSNSRIIRENFNLFSSKGLQFCFVTTPDVIGNVSEAEELFPNKVELGPFENKSSVESLIASYFSIAKNHDTIGTQFSSEAIDTIWKLSKGNPYTVQQLCSKSYLKALDADSKLIEVGHVIEAIPDKGLEI